MRLRQLRKVRQEMNGWPTVTHSYRDPGQWALEEPGHVSFHRMTRGRIIITSWPRAAWRGLK
jgi:hypothetical protein